MINTSIHSHSSLENHTQLQTKMGKVYTCFQTKTAKKTLPCGTIIGDSGADGVGEGGFRPLELSLSPKICPWVSEKGAAHNCGTYL